MCIRVFTCMWASILFMCLVLEEFRRGHYSLWNGSLWMTMNHHVVLLTTEPYISPAPNLSLFYNEVKENNASL
ncbi:rCG58470 [Rattus norvegicus]|uniref:RCG58470 n=1 Tax=Rattus norvegicus TaxID=10116 RepID=A6J4K6_RAT|nr:rCG58470 [Rattus norvegicus]